MRKWYQDKYFWFAALAGFVIAIVSFLPTLIQNGGFMALRDDFDYQQIYFNYLSNEAIKNGELGWSWSIDLGSDIITSMSFYTLGSPFFWLYMLLPAKTIPYVIAPLLSLKYAVAACGSYLYIRRFTKKETSALIGAILYAFSGYTAAVILFNHFHDVVALFPFLLIALEDKIANRRRGLFALAVCINCLCNYYFFIGEVIFLVLYYLFRFARKDKKMVFEITGLILEGAAGVLAAGVLFVPSIIAVLNNPRSSSGIDLTSAASWKFRLMRYLAILKAFIFPADSMSGQSCIAEHDYSSCAFYLPGVSISLALAYVFTHKDRLTKFMALLLVICMVPVLCSAFLLFKEVTFRWIYMFILLLALASAKVIDEDLLKTKTTRICVMVNIALIPVFLVLLRAAKHMGKLAGETDASGIIRPKQFYTRLIMSLIALTVLLFFTFKGSFKISSIAILALTSVMGALPLMAVVSDYREGYDPTLRKDWYEASLALADYDFDDNYRANNTRNYFCMAGGAHGLENFCSTITGSIYETHSTFGLTRGPQVINIFDTPGLKQYLSGKYLIADSMKSGAVMIYKYDAAGRKWYIVDEGPVCPVAYTFDRCILPSQLQMVPINMRAMVAMNYLALPSEYAKDLITVEEYEEILLLSGELEVIRNGYLDAAVASSNERIAPISDITSKGFTVTVQETDDPFLFVSCPYSEGWSAAGDIGGAKKIYKVNGFMAVEALPGEVITFTYETPGLKAGIACSIIGVIAIAALVITSPQSNKRSLQTVNHDRSEHLVQ
ncbi:MAG: YfhO family protein [Saccharofermentans sp.]|nr:YfhO family protein [Saccharofermentans sp.]